MTVKFFNQSRLASFLSSISIQYFKSKPNALGRNILNQSSKSDFILILILINVQIVADCLFFAERKKDKWKRSIHYVQNRYKWYWETIIEQLHTIIRLILKCIKKEYKVVFNVGFPNLIVKVWTYLFTIFNCNLFTGDPHAQPSMKKLKLHFSQFS